MDGAFLSRSRCYCKPASERFHRRKEALRCKPAPSDGLPSGLVGSPHVFRGPHFLHWRQSVWRPPCVKDMSHEERALGTVNPRWHPKPKLSRHGHLSSVNQEDMHKIWAFQVLLGHTGSIQARLAKAINQGAMNHAVWRKLGKTMVTHDVACSPEQLGNTSMSVTACPLLLTRCMCTTSAIFSCYLHSFASTQDFAQCGMNARVDSVRILKHSKLASLSPSTCR